jgi:hypothetical protein
MKSFVLPTLFALIKYLGLIALNSFLHILYLIVIDIRLNQFIKFPDVHQVFWDVSIVDNESAASPRDHSVQHLEFSHGFLVVTDFYVTEIESCFPSLRKEIEMFEDSPHHFLG